MHGHIEMLFDNAKYVAFFHSNALFIISMNSGVYPTTVDQTNSVICDHHKLQEIEFETYLGVTQALHDHIMKTIIPEWLEAIKSPTLGSTHKSPKEMLTHLHGIVLPLTL